MSARCGKVKEAGRKDQRGGEWSGAEEVRYKKSSVGEVSSGTGKVSSGTGKVSIGGEVAAPVVLFK